MSLLKSDPLDARQVRDKLQCWVEENKQLGSDHFFINELGFYNKIPDQRPETAFRADLVSVGQRLAGFEIKSEKDNLKRWEAQKTAYTNVFDEVWLCAHEKHLFKALQSTPEHIGIISLSATNELQLERPSIVGHGLNNSYDLSSMLWREELDELGGMYGIKWTARTNKKQVREILTTELTLEQIMEFVIKKLDLRKNILNLAVE